MSAWLEALHVHVPEKEGSVIVDVEFDDLTRLGVVMLVEEKQLDGRRVSRKD
jgi:hypothetical protein